MKFSRILIVSSLDFQIFKQHVVTMNQANFNEHLWLNTHMVKNYAIISRLQQLCNEVFSNIEVLWTFKITFWTPSQLRFSNFTILLTLFLTSA